MPDLLPAIGDVQGGCLCCPPKPGLAPLDWQPHPGFGGLTLTRDGETPEWWNEYADLWSRDEYFDYWTKWRSVKTGEMEPYRIVGTEQHRLVEEVTLADIEECVAEDPDHDWRLIIDGPLSGVTYQRQGCAQWVAVEKNMGFA